MSTTDQQNSIPIQRAAIQQYATLHGYEVVATYSDSGKSGVEIKHRAGLRQLLHDVVGGQTRFRIILVYDVSRWGRFQDTDESAHYEFLCRSAGVPIHYCAEQFENNGSMPNAIMKALKRTMAAEYSRELAIKVLAGQRRIAAQGFHAGGTAGYGLRRMLISSDGRRKQILELNERKNVKSDRIILVPGPRHEVECIRTIFALAAEKRKTPQQIAEELNRRRMKGYGDKSWNKCSVYNVLKNEKYMGSNVWGKTAKPFNKYDRKLPSSAWTTKAGAFAPLVSPRQFACVQRVLKKRLTKTKRPDKYFLNRMRMVLAREGKITQKLLRKRRIYNNSAYRRRFGSIMQAYERIGYEPSTHALRSAEGVRKMKRLREGLLLLLAQLFPSQVRTVQRPGQTQRQAVELDHWVQIAVHVCRRITPHRSR
jgi:DNA invertase Pin-like site-specific DNA recombinase